VSPQAELEISLRLVAALVLGALIGAEREYHRHPAGLRTMSAICVGSALFTALGTMVLNTDPTRIAAQIVTGVGFLGAGAILRSGASIRGLTTAATIWVVAAVGMSVGFGYFILATICTALVLVLLIGLRRIEVLRFREPDDAQE
jgi:putative Mg2+ transporter-C (MgtC) family protein